MVLRQEQAVSAIEDESAAIAISASVRDHLARLKRPDVRRWYDRGLANCKGNQSDLQLCGVDARREQEEASYLQALRARDVHARPSRRPKTAYGGKRGVAT